MIDEMHSNNIKRFDQYIEGFIFSVHFIKEKDYIIFKGYGICYLPVLFLNLHSIQQNIAVLQHNSSNPSICVPMYEKSRNKRCLNLCY